MNDLFYLAIGGSILVLIGAIQIMRKYPRLPAELEDPYLLAVAERAWKTGKPIIGTVDENGTLTMREGETERAAPLLKETEQKQEG